MEENKKLQQSVEKLTELINNSNIGKKTVKNISNTNNGQIIQNQNNQQNNINIKMVSFGEEDINKLKGEILNVLKSRGNAFINLVKLIHLNKRLPEYNNILMNNLRSDYASIINDNKLVVCNTWIR